MVAGLGPVNVNQFLYKREARMASPSIWNQLVEKINNRTETKE